MLNDPGNQEIGEVAEALRRLADRLDLVAGQTTSDDPSQNQAMRPGQRLFYARSRAGLSQSALAKKANVSVNSIINFEKGHTVPRIRTLMAIADAVGIPWEMLSEEHQE